MKQLDHLVGQQAKEVVDQAITFEDGTLVHAATDVPAEVEGLTLVQVKGAEDSGQPTDMVFGAVTLDSEGNSSIANETTVTLDPAEYGIAAPEEEITYPEKPQDPEAALPADPSSERITDQPLTPAETPPEAPENGSEGENGQGEG